MSDELSNLKQRRENEVVKPLSEWSILIRKQFLINYQILKLYLDSVDVELTDKEGILKQTKYKIAEKWKLMQESAQFIFGANITLKEINLQEVESFLLDKVKWLKENYNQMGFDEEPTDDEILSKIHVLMHEKEVSSYFPDHLDKLKETLNKNRRNNLFIDTLMNRLNDVIKLKIPAEYEEYFGSYDELTTKEERYKDILIKVNDYSEEIKDKYDMLTTIQTQVLGDNLHGHPIIGWVYRTIVPHAYYKDLQIRVNKQGATFISEGIRDNLFLDQIFSQAQLNILALSIFLGIGLTQQYSRLNQLFLDDPIQSMDDVNILAFIDVLRAIIDSKISNKRLIISTHDDNFAELLSIKMRNKNIVQYRVEAYGSEGPIITRV